MKNWKRILCVAMAAALTCPPVGVYATEQTTELEYALETEAVESATEQTEETETIEVTEGTEVIEITEVAETTEVVDESEVTEAAEETQTTETTGEPEVVEVTETTEVTEETEATEVEDEIHTATLAESKTVSPNGTYTGAIAEKGNYNLYYFTLPEAGHFTIEMTAQMQYCGVDVYSDDETNLLSETADWNENTKKSVSTYELDLTAGTYYIRVNADGYYYGYYSYTGTYSMKLTYTSAGETFAEPNNDFASATEINFPSTVKGQIAKNDDKDFFKFKLTDAGTVKLYVTSYMNSFSMVIYDASGNSVYQSYGNKWNENLKMTEKDYAVDLAPGSYYMLVNGQNGKQSYDYKYTGNYNFTANFEKAKVSYTQADDDFASAYNLPMNQEIWGHIALNDREDIMTFTLSKETCLSFTITSYMPHYDLYFYNSKGEQIGHEYNNRQESLGYVTDIYEKNLDAGKYYVKVEGAYINSTGSYYTGQYILKVTARIDIAEASIAAIKDQPYTGDYIMPEPVVTYQGKTLVKDVDYTLTYANNYSIGVGSVTILGCGDYHGNKTVTFNIVGPSLSKASISKIGDKTYTGKAVKPAVTVKYNGKTLTKDVDYTVSYKNNKKVGTASATIKGIGDYSGSKTVEFKITAAKISDVAFGKVSNKTYTGKAIKPSVSVEYKGTKLTKDTDYTVSYKNNKNMGTATITVKGKGNFTGTKKVTFKITPKKVTISKAVNNKKGTATVSWKRDKNVTGYEIYCSTKKSSGYKLEKDITKNKTTSYTDKNLTKGKNYYYKIRAYKKVNDKKVYGSYSSVKSVKINK